MAVDFLEADKAIEALLEELKKLKTTSQQLQEAGAAAVTVVAAAEKVTDVSANVISNGARQLDAVAQLTAGSEHQFATAINKMAELSANVEQHVRATLEASAKQAAELETRITEAIQDQQDFAGEINDFIHSDLVRRYDEIRRLANVNRWILAITLALTLVNVSALVWFTILPAIGQ